MMGIEKIARITHELNRAHAEVNGDDSHVHWEDAEDWQRRSAIRGVQYILDHPDTTPKQLYDRWYQDKVSQGWVYGPEKDPVKKTHPCLVPYDDLPIEDKVKDYLFCAVVRLLTAE